MNRFRSIFGLASATQYLVLANLIVYAIQVLQQPKRAGMGLFDLFGISRITSFEVTFGLITPAQIPDVFWQLVTYMFLHGGLWHILFNIWALWTFGQALETVWGMKRFFLYYFVTGIGAGLTVVTISLFQPSLSITIGASGAIYGLLLAFGLLFPNQPLYLFFIPVPVPAKYAVLLLGGFAFVASITGILPGISNIGHLGGLLFGLLYLKSRSWWRRLRDLSR